jgi:hypothetical protein
MYRTTETPTRERCAEHDLAVGPAGECVLCRRARARVGGVGNARPRWLGPALVAASLGTLLLGGAALARTRPSTGAPPVQEPVTGEMPRPVVAPLEVRASVPVAPTPHEVRPAPAPAPPVAPPRNYLDEAYAAMPKGNLYDEALAPQAATTAPGCPCRTTGCQRQYLLAYGGRMRSTGSRVSGTPTVQVQVQQTVAPAPMVQYGHAGGSLSRGVAVRH